jgi:hypothetical protein
MGYVFFLSGMAATLTSARFMGSIRLRKTVRFMVG